jgi:hypothetical protein
MSMVTMVPPGGLDDSNSLHRLRFGRISTLPVHGPVVSFSAVSPCCSRLARRGEIFKGWEAECRPVP